MSTVAVSVELQVDPDALRKQILTLIDVKSILTPYAADDVGAIIEVLDEVLEKIIIIENKREEG